MELSPMKQTIAQLSLLVREYDEAIQFYVEKMNFLLLEDTALENNKRWVRVAPPGTPNTALLLAKADGEAQINAIGNQTGGRVFLFLQTDDFWRDYNKMIANGIVFIEKPREEIYGTVAVFKDLYGNLWDLITPTKV